MSNNKTSKNIRNQRNRYILGTEALQYDILPEKRRYDDYEVPEIEKRREPERKTKEHAKEHAAVKPVGRIDFISMFVLIASICATVMICAYYLKLRSDMRLLNSEVLTLKEDLKDLNDKNDTIKVSIETAVDFDKVYEIAVGELGMVYPNENNVINYGYNNDGYVRQYEEIPESKKQQILKSLFE